tara:strand:+ start:521 stop:1204 length:684 start_codon:yes stop_codon:yes gene_type:complete
MTDLNTHYRSVKKYKNTLLREEKPHFDAAVKKSFFMYKNFSEFFHNKNILDYGCSIGFTSWAFSLFCKSTHCYDPNPNCEFVFRQNNNNNEKLKWVDVKTLQNTHYDTVFIYGVHNGHPHPHKLIEEFVNSVSFDYLIIGDSDGKLDDNTSKFDPIEKKRRIISGQSAIYTYSLHSISLTHIDDCIPKVSNLKILRREHDLLFPSLGITGQLEQQDQKNIIYVCKKL